MIFRPALIGFRKPPSGGGVVTPSIRAQQAYALGGGDPIIVPIPGGAQVGDRCIMFAGGSWNPQAIAGFTTHDNQAGANWNGHIQSKVLTSGDISAGSFTQDYAGNHGNSQWIVVMVGNPTVVTAQAIRDTSSVSPRTVTTAAVTPQIGDLALLFASCRSSVNTPPFGIDAGTLHSQADEFNGASAGWSKTVAANGAVAATFTESPLGAGAYKGILVLRT